LSFETSFQIAKQKMEIVLRMKHASLLTWILQQSISAVVLQDLKGKLSGKYVEVRDKIISILYTLGL